MQHTELMEHMQNRLLALGRTRKEDFVGCTETEILQIRDSQGVKCVPGLYEDFLRRMGHRAGYLFVGTDTFFPQLLHIKNYAVQLLDIYKDLHLPENAFVFSMHQGYSFLYFEADCSQTDPVVYGYMETHMEFDRIAEHLSEYFEDEVSNLERASTQNLAGRIRRT